LSIGGLALVLSIGLIPIYKNLKGKQLCFTLKNDQLNGEIANKLKEHYALEGRAIYDYCAKIGVIEMITELFPL